MNLHVLIFYRQRTPYDESAVIPDARGVPTGSRVFGDCDKFMAALMRELLGEELQREWEEGREARMKVYDERRQ